MKLKRKKLNLKPYILAFVLPPSIIFGLCGCYVADLVTPEPHPYNDQIAASYDAITLKQSSSADVLAMYSPEYELLSQSKSIIASHGQNKNGYKNWLTMVAFDEKNLLAKRKYLLIADEKPKIFHIATLWPNLAFDCQMVLEDDIFEEPYADENARCIAILKHALENSRADIRQIGSDSKTVEVCGALINQTFEAVLVTLESSPALATKLSEPEGVAFSHTSFGKGKVGVLIDDDIVAVRIRAGAATRDFENITYSDLP